MATGFIFRYLLVVPAAHVAAVAGFLIEFLDPNADPDLGPPLNATGDPTKPITHRWMFGAYTQQQADAMIAKFAQLAGLPAPPSVPMPPSAQWITLAHNALLQGLGIWLSLMANAADWIDPAAVLSTMKLKPLEPPAEGG